MGVDNGERPGMPFVSSGLLPSQNEPVVLVSVSHELGVLFEAAPLRGYMVAAIADSAVNVALHGGVALLMLLALKVPMRLDSLLVLKTSVTKGRSCPMRKRYSRPGLP